MDNSVSIEVLGKNGLYYKAFVQNIYPDKLEVIYENGLGTKVIPFEDARLPSLPSEKTTLNTGDEIEFYVRNEEGLGWCGGILKQIRGEFAVIDFATGSEIFPLDHLRHRNKNPSLTSLSFHSATYDVPEDLHSTCTVEEEDHVELKKASGVEVVRVDPVNHTITVIYGLDILKSSNKEAVEKASILFDMHLRNLKQKMLIISRLQELSKKLESMKQSPKAPFQEEFTVDRELMGLAIGYKGKNIAHARDISGITSIEIEEASNLFRVYGESEVAVKKARAQLEFLVKKVPVHKDLVSKVIGKNGHCIQDIVNKSGVVRVKINDFDQKQEHGDCLHQTPSISPSPLEENIEFMFTGKSENICYAVMLLDYQISHLKEVDKLRQEKLTIDEEIKSLNPFPPYRGRRGQDGDQASRGSRWSAERNAPSDDGGKDSKRASFDSTSTNKNRPNNRGGTQGDSGRRRPNEIDSTVLDDVHAANGAYNGPPRGNNRRNRNRPRKNQDQNAKQQKKGRTGQINGFKGDGKNSRKSSVQNNTSKREELSRTPTETAVLVN